MKPIRILAEGICAIVLLVAPSYVNAQSDCDADRLLVPTQTSAKLNRLQELALAELIDSKEKYDAVVGSGASGSYGLWGADLSYEDSKQRTTERLQKENFQVTKQEAEQLATSFLPPELASEYVRCKIAVAGGVLLTAADVTPSAATLVVSWIPGENVHGPLPLGVQIDPLSEKNKDALKMLPLQLEGRFARSILLTKEPDEDLRVAISVGNSSNHILVPKYPQPPEQFSISAIRNSATATWVSTGIEVAPGDLLTIKASGSAWYLQGDDLTKSGPEGHPYTCENQPSSLRCGALIARIGSENAFVVGGDYRERVKSGGELMLAYQDLDNVNNDGGYEVTIDVEK